MKNMDAHSRRPAGLAKARTVKSENARGSVVRTEIPRQNRLSRLHPTRRPLVERRLSQMPKHCRNTYLRALGGRSRKSAIKAFCLECTGWQRAEVARCTALACPLWPYRPFGRNSGSRGENGTDTIKRPSG